MASLTLHNIVTKMSDVRALISGIALIAAIAVAVSGMLKLPAQQEAVAETLKKHNDQVHEQTDATNRKLDVLICLQAKLDTPIRCVAKEHQR